MLAANEAKPYARNAPTAKTARTAMISNDFRLGKDDLLGIGVVVPKSNFFLFTPDARITQT